MKISIIVPIYNSEKHLKRCLESLVNQTYKNTEIILINDGSTDKYEKICKLYMQKHKNIKYFYQSNMGVSVARNKGIEFATGDYITFIDSDDFIELYTCEELAQSINNTYPDILIYGWSVTSPTNFNFKDSYIIPKLYKYTKGNIFFPNQYSDLIYKMEGSSWGKIYNLKFLKKHKIFFPSQLRCCEDIVFLYNAIFNSTKLAVNPNKYYIYMVPADHNGLTSRKESSIYLSIKSYDLIKKLMLTHSIKKNKSLIMAHYARLLFCTYYYNDNNLFTIRYDRDIPKFFSLLSFTDKVLLLKHLSFWVLIFRKPVKLCKPLISKFKK